MNVHLVWVIAEYPVCPEHRVWGEPRGGRFSYWIKYKEIDMCGRKDG